MSDIKSYKPENNSICSGMVLQCAYTVENARLVVREMTDLMSLDLVEKGMVTDQIVLTIGYDIENLLTTEENDEKNVIKNKEKLTIKEKVKSTTIYAKFKEGYSVHQAAYGGSRRIV